MMEPLNDNNYASFTKEKLIEELKKYKEIVNMFSNTIIGGVAKMNVADMSLINATDGYYEMTGYTKEESHLPPFNDCGLNLVIPEDIEIMQEKLEVLFTKNEGIRVEYRIRKKDGSIAWNTAFCPGIQESNGERFIEVFFLDTTQEKITELQFANLINNMPSGLVCMKIKDTLQILYANNEFYKQCGYTEKEFKRRHIMDNYMKLVDFEDQERLQTTLQAFINNQSKVEITDYRIHTKDGKTRWIRAHISQLFEDQIQCVLNDITKDRINEQVNRINEERFRIISEETKDVIFDWDVESDTLRYSPVYEKMLGYPTPESTTSEELLNSNIIHEDDKAMVAKVIHDLRHSTDYAECKARLRRADGTYFWSLHRIRAIHDPISKYKHVVGIISDVNDLMENTIRLQKKAEHDSLTGLLNRITAQHLIENKLTQEPSGKYIFIQIDIDRFKQINDFMGHVAGDFALQKIAQQMRNAFRLQDYLIRMGGDEFAIFMEDSIKNNELLNKIDEFIKNVNCDFKFEEKIYPLSISAGIAFYPKDGADFEQLYKHADEAMYIAKRKGGNQFVVYSTSQKRC